MHYIIYKTTCLTSGKYYIGKHKTLNLNDGYLGSGLLLKKAIIKYGKNNFIREILFECQNKDELNVLERQIVDDALVKDGGSYNLALGGQGGDLGQAIYDKRSLLWTNEKRKLLSTTMKALWKNPSHRNKISELMRKKMKGNVNDKFVYATKGCKWISNVELKIRKSVKSQDINKYLENGWVIGMKKFVTK